MRVTIIVAAWTILLSSSAAPARATTINPGFDLLFMPTETATIPGLGDVTEHGVQIGPGDTDTIIQRFNGLTDGQSGIINAQIVDLSIAGTLLDGPFAGDTFSTALDPSHASLGQDNVTNPTGPGGGTFTSFFDVFTDISIFNGTTLVAVVPHEDAITSVGATVFLSTPVPGYPNDPTHPTGGFDIGPAGVSYTGPFPHFDPATVSATVPEPATLTLTALGLAGVMRRYRRRRTSR